MRKFIVIIFILLGGVIGIALGDLCSTVKGLEWLSIGGQIGLKDPVVVNLSFIEFTLGLWLKVNIACVIGLALFAILSRKILDWVKI